ncbi:flagellar hook protein FlgE [Buchnera aphidicola str. Ak (Acyrthosiphon kondoi)]|uniref:Flagellar hook protein FlgE n=1 Tax=Buchnera aphidicola str. Ak (Acyrthosiphon kondoi) TaxID=1005090 RepID=G2LN50_9GAMM|nr:flagellar hook protein FlgE [Buchnera aphidicola]AEO08688.1 flagellar hook protein FlgE [Buchnera aphidicola str. Ak (Acyrthosiphon kondoi)]
MSTMGAVSGLLINSDYIDIISNNIANASTIGYKSSKPIFFDMFSHSFYSNTTNGYGVEILNVIQNFNNGMLVQTGRDLDLGIVKDGFFRVIDAEGNVHYTRDGQFFLDKNQNIVNTQGLYLTGKNKSYSQNNFNNGSSTEAINLKNAYILNKKPTSIITLKAILNRNTNTIKNIDSSSNDFSNSEDYATHIGIYNKDGEKDQITISFKKQNKNTWKVYVKSDHSNNHIKDINDSFDLKFNSDGELISNKSFHIQSKNLEKYENITLDFNGTIEKSDIDSSFEEYSQDGYPQGFLQTFNVSSNGEIIAKYSNQKQQTIGQILLSKFINPEKLQPESGNLWSATSESGSEIITSGDQDSEILNAKTLEASNVDLNKELINMIIAQRNYQSNAQSFKTEDKIINTLINLK